MTFREYIEEMTGYKMKTTYLEDFETAEVFGGEKAIRDTYKRAMKYWSENVEYVTEICMVLNWRMFLWYERGNKKMSLLYEELWRDCDKWCMNNLKGKDLEYFLHTTD